MARKKFTTSLEEKLIIRLKKRALDEGRDANDILEELLVAYFDQIQDKKDEAK